MTGPENLPCRIPFYLQKIADEPLEKLRVCNLKLYARHFNALAHLVDHNIAYEIQRRRWNAEKLDESPIEPEHPIRFAATLVQVQPGTMRPAAFLCAAEKAACHRVTLCCHRCVPTDCKQRRASANADREHRHRHYGPFRGGTLRRPNRLVRSVIPVFPFESGWISKKRRIAGTSTPSRWQPFRSVRQQSSNQLPKIRIA